MSRSLELHRSYFELAGNLYPQKFEWPQALSTNICKPAEKIEPSGQFATRACGSTTRFGVSMRGLQSKQSSYNYTLQRSSQQKALEDRPSSTGASRIAKQQPPQSLAKHGSLALISATAILAGLVYFAASKSAVVSKGSGPANSFVPSRVAEMQALFGIEQPIVVIEGRRSLAGESLQGTSSGYGGLGIITASSPKARIYGVGL